VNFSMFPPGKSNQRPTNRCGQRASSRMLEWSDSLQVYARWESGPDRNDVEKGACSVLNLSDKDNATRHKIKSDIHLGSHVGMQGRYLHSASFFLGTRVLADCYRQRPGISAPGAPAARRGQSKPDWGTVDAQSGIVRASTELFRDQPSMQRQ